jgi:branched-chain amino acid transport system ATP-binding protein
MVEQNVKRALSMGDFVYLFANGKGVFKGKPDELLSHPELAKLYLGIT